METRRVCLAAIIILVMAFSFSAGQENSGVKLRTSNSIRTSFYYSPETGVKTQGMIGMFSSISSGGNISASFYMYGLYESEATAGTGFESPRIRQIRPYIRNIRLNLTGPLFPNTKSLTMSIGQATLNFSPYIASFNRTYSPSAQGVTLQGFRWNKFDIGGFLFFESGTSYKDLGEGIQVKYSSGPLKLDTILVRHLHGEPVLKEQQIEKLGVYQLMEQDLQLQFDYRFLNGVTLHGLHIEHKKTGVIPSSLNLLELKYPRPNSQWTVTYWDCDTSFSPRYRDKTPKLASNFSARNFDLKASPENPVDQYRNKKGAALAMTGSVWGRPLRLRLEHEILKKEQEPTITLDANIGRQERSFGILGSYNPDELQVKYLQVGTRLKLAQRALGDLFGHVSYIYDRTGRNNDLNYRGDIRRYGIEYSFNNGFFRGLSLDMGLQNAEKNRYYLKGSWLMFRHIQVLFSYTTPNTIEGEDWWIDDFDRIRYRDNFIRFTSSLGF